MKPRGPDFPARSSHVSPRGSKLVPPGGVRSVGFALLLSLAGVCMAADPVIEAKLAQADAVRTSHPAEFARILSELDNHSARATPEQQAHLKLLHTYRSILRGDSEGAIRNLQSVMAETDNLRLRYRAGAMLANTYAITRQFESGLKVLDRILPQSRDVTDSDSRHHGWLAAAILYNQVGEFALGKHYAQQVQGDSPGARSRCIAGDLELESLQGLGSMPEESTIQAAIAQCAALDETILTGFAWTYLARKRYAEGRVAEAIEVLERYLPQVEETAYPRLISEYHSMLADYRMSRGDRAVAQRHAQRAIEQSADIASSQSLVVAYKVLFEIAERDGDPAAALRRYMQYAEAERANFSDVKSREMAYQLVRHQSLQQTQHIALLNQQNALLQLQQRVQKQSAQNSRLAIGLLVLLAAFIALWAYRTKRMQLSLRRMAETDALTGICNRHHFNLRAEQLLGQCERSGEEVALVMLDLDHFKSINDRYGHATGDWVLRKVAEVCTPLCREVDVFGRLGGEEFAVLIAGHDLRSARRMADDLRVRLAGIDTSGSGDVFRVTASFGVATSQFTGHDLSRLMSNADRMLYRAKRGGRNRVCVYEGQVSPTHAIPVRAVEDSLLATDDAPSVTETDTGLAPWAADKPRNVATS